MRETGRQGVIVQDDSHDNDEGALIELEKVALLFRSYGKATGSLKQAALNKLFRRKYQDVEDFWIYRDLDLKITHGEQIGVIGPNGAGKSTLLKLMCGIYHPTHGKIRVRGRVAPMIGLGAGMHRELSGRENILLNGAMLGFGPKAMREKTGSILDFAGLQDFAETPIKYYSTGMMRRLAFSVATDINPEILVIDEVFAGGDAEFVARATERIERVMDTSHIVVMVSHTLALLRKISNRVVWIEDGEVHMDGDPDEVCAAYQAAHVTKKAPVTPKAPKAPVAQVSGG